MIVTERLSLVVVASPGRLRDSLGVLLRGNVEGGVLEVMDGVGCVLEYIAAHLSTLVMLGADVHQRWALRSVRGIKARWPRVRCVLLAHNLKQWRLALAANADGVVLAGCASEAFLHVIRQVLSAGWT